MQGDTVSMTSHMSIEQLNQVTRQQVVEMKCLCAPPEMVIKVMGAALEVVCGVQKPNRQDTWLACQSKMLANPNQMIKKCIEIFSSIGKDPKLDQRIRGVKKVMQDPGMSYERAMNTSKPLGAMYLWLTEVIEHEELMNGKK